MPDLEVLPEAGNFDTLSEAAKAGGLTEDTFAALLAQTTSFA